jgi:D-alanyl-D-alanine carboxypeptidase
MGLFSVKLPLALIGLGVLIGVAILIARSHSEVAPPPPPAYQLTSISSSTPPALLAASYVVINVAPDGSETTLASREPDAPHAIASITKLMTAYVASQKFTGTDVITVAKESLPAKGRSGVYQGGEQLTFQNALYALLIASHNDIASALAYDYGRDFIEAMNQTASQFGLSHTHYVNPTGLDPDQKAAPINQSTADDLAHLLRALKERAPDLLAITRTPAYTLVDVNGAKLADLVSTDTLLSDQGLPFTIIGGKTGETPDAKQNLALALSAPCNSTLYAVVLDSTDRAADMKAILAYVHDAFRWSCGAVR